MGALVALLIEETPTIIDRIKTLYAAQHPTAPALTNEEVLAGLETLFASSLAKDDAIRAELEARLAAEPQ